MNVFVRGFNLDALDDEFIIVTTLQEQQMSVPLARHSVEDLEASVFVNNLLHNWRTDSRTWAVPNESDPPDFILNWAGREWALELTKLTVGDVRSEIAQARRFARTIRERVAQDAASYPHLSNRLVNIFTGQGLRENKKGLVALAETVLERLKEDRGVMQPIAVGPDGSMPATLDPQGFYGDVGPVNITEAAIEEPDTLVVAHVQAQVFASEAVASLTRKVTEKDIAGNEVLAISCGLPDQSGFACHADGALFELVGRAAGSGQLQLNPRHLKFVVMHSPLRPPLVLHHDEQAFPLP